MDPKHPSPKDLEALTREAHDTACSQAAHTLHHATTAVLHTFATMGCALPEDPAQKTQFFLQVAPLIQATMMVTDREMTIRMGSGGVPGTIAARALDAVDTLETLGALAMQVPAAEGRK